MHKEKEALARAAKEERRRLHQEKAEVAKTQKQERLRLQEKRRAAAQEQAAERRLTAKRKNAIRSIPYWLGNIPQCFDLTMEALNLQSVKKSNKDGLAAEYKQLYLHSIPSFYQTLAEEETLQEALDVLVEAGFADLKWAKQHRQRAENQVHLDRLKARIIKACIQREKQEGKLKAFQKRLEQIKEQEAVKDKKEAVENEPESSGLIGRALNAVSSLFTGAPEEQTTNTPFPERVQIKSFKVKRQEGAVSDVEKQLERIHRNVKLLEEERDSYKFDMTQEEYERANEVVENVMPEICQSLASHIHERHSESIEQYRLLDSKTDLTKPHEWYLHARLDRRKVSERIRFIDLVYRMCHHSPVPLTADYFSRWTHKLWKDLHGSRAA